MTRATLQINGMSCNHCVIAVREELLKLEPKGLLLDDIKIGSAKLEFDEKQLSREEIADAVKEAGYSVASWSAN